MNLKSNTPEEGFELSIQLSQKVYIHNHHLKRLGRDYVQKM